MATVKGKTGMSGKNTHKSHPASAHKMGGVAVSKSPSAGPHKTGSKVHKRTPTKKSAKIKSSK